ncbi:hypothetical protein HPB47_025762 [Ixodes persulcatus]|uniref:Uncharacterized protein n=1 Tax=Ixodes persulcatus TaxID=34615 RepID=A0AC60Q0M2_IXOPE|nr:hypothetical protein HPB47_025762 [Ixodes persulcatus]
MWLGFVVTLLTKHLAPKVQAPPAGLGSNFPEPARVRRLRGFGGPAGGKLLPIPATAKDPPVNGAAFPTEGRTFHAKKRLEPLPKGGFKVIMRPRDGMELAYYESQEPKEEPCQEPSQAAAGKGEQGKKPREEPETPATRQDSLTPAESDS